MDDSRTVQWRRDASTSRTVRLLWSFGVGTFLAMVGLIVFWRLFDLAGQLGTPSALAFGLSITPPQAVIGAALAALAATILAFAAAGDAERRLERLTRSLPITPPSGAGLRQAADAAVGMVVMGAVIGLLMVGGRVASQHELLAVGAGPFTGLAALLLPLAVVAIVLSAFLQSVGALDVDERTIYLYDPEEAVDLEHIEAVSVRRLGDATVLKLSYAQPDGQYVQGPRRLVVPPEVAREVQALVE
ncbi:hypothetical protein [Natrononativus amylolyticus]|uniref:hypothetical protein n=1 Tax=Natrononativus amylolyticus TaxID=2963434 RepID=UPI0020CD6801|nr:hypothetical protein [Natrononativus amylolyticus]